METVYSITMKALAANEVSREVAASHMAMEPTKNPQDYAPLIYPPCPQALTQYANDRRNDLLPRKKEFAIANGNWLYETRRVRSRNRNSMDLLRDDIATLERIGNQDGSEKVSKILKRLTDNERNYDQAKYHMHSEVQAKDMRERLMVEGF